jgi:hypothetical protein
MGITFQWMIAAGTLSLATALPAQTMRCLTGNAPDPSANARLDGRYTYYDGGTFSYLFPRQLVPGKLPAPIHEPNRNGGWISFGEGVLTDGKTETAAGWPQYWISSRGMDVFFDLGRECFIERIELVAKDATIRNAALWLKSAGDERETMVFSATDRPTFATNYFPKLESPYLITNVNASARWVRVNGCWKGSAYPGWSEIRIWGRPMDDGEPRPPKIASRQRDGRFVIAKPKQLPLERAPERAIFPIPRETKPGKGHFVLSSRTRLVIASDASQRTETTARVFAEDLKEITGLELKVKRGKTTGKDCIMIGTTPHPASPPRGEEQPGTREAAISSRLGGEDQGEGWRSNLSHGYSIDITSATVEVTGNDDQGAFYGTQSLLQLVGLNTKRQWDVPAVTVRDWPRNPIRYVSGGQPPTESLLRALARYKINYYDTPEGANVQVAITNRQFAEDRFVKIVPSVGFEGSWSSNPELCVERPAGEKLETLGVGRRNPCPSQPAVWSNFFSRVDRAAACNGDYIRVGMDEMYQPANGSRWNVCDLCRARNLSGHELMAETIQKIHGHLKAKGKKVCIIDSPFHARGISHPDDAANDWRKIVTMLPNDMLVYVWHPKEVLEPLHRAGYPLLRWAVSAFKDENPPEYLGQYLNLHDGPFYVEQLLAMSQLCWSPEQALPTTAKCTAHLESAMPRFRELWTGERVPSRQPGAEFFPFDLKPVANTSLVDDAPGDGKGFADLGGNYDLRALTPGRRTLDGVPFHIGRNAVRVDNRLAMNRSHPERVEIPLNQKAASLVFLHTLDDRPGQNYMLRHELCGYYFMVFEDGAYDKLEIKYNINIANFDGIMTWWDYNPRSESLKRATLAWKGETGAGQPAALYHAEWTNPRPEVKISKIVFASPHMPVPSSPVLIAVTGVKANDTPHLNPLPQGERKSIARRPAATASGRSSPPGGESRERGESVVATLRDVSLLTPAKPVGIPINLTAGVNESDLRWVTRDGVAVECEGNIANADRTGGCEPFWARTSSAVFYNLEWTRCEIAPGIAVKVTLPEPRKLSGVAITGSYRDEAYFNDFPPSMLDYIVEASADGQTWYPVTAEKVTGYIPEEEGAKWHSLDGKPVKAVRVHVWRNNGNSESQRYERGVSFLQLFASE